MEPHALIVATAVTTVDPGDPLDADGVEPELHPAASTIADSTARHELAPPGRRMRAVTYVPERRQPSCIVSTEALTLLNVETVSICTVVRSPGED